MVNNFAEGGSCVNIELGAMASLFIVRINDTIFSENHSKYLGGAVSINSLGT